MENKLVPSSLLLHVIAVCSLLGIVHRLYSDLHSPLSLKIMEKKKKAKQQQQNVCILSTGNLHRQCGQWCVFKTNFLLQDYTSSYYLIFAHNDISYTHIMSADTTRVGAASNNLGENINNEGFHMYACF